MFLFDIPALNYYRDVSFSGAVGSYVAWISFIYDENISY